ncbi:unnamed protein product, partial [Closterium sp. Yama58-4]
MAPLRAYYLNKEAVTILLHKVGDKEQLNNYRPITLLNFAYKVLARVVADRMKSVLHMVISPEQYGFIPGRRLSDAVALVADIIEGAKSDKDDCHMLLVDFQKAFDSVSRDFLFQVLESMGFPERFVGWVKGLHEGTTTKLLINGWLGEGADVVSGVRQGCPLAPYLFLCAVEPLALEVERKELGLEKDGHRLGYLGYADDTTLVLQGEAQIGQAEEILDHFEKVSGLATNKDKSVVLPLGAGIGATGGGSFKLAGADEVERLLGIWVTPSGSGRPTWEKAWSRISKKLTKWQLKYLTITARATVVFYITPILAFQAQIFPPPADIWLEIMRLIHSFTSGNRVATAKGFALWSRELLFTPRLDGGIGVRDPEILITRLAARRVRLFITEKNPLKRDLMERAAKLPLGLDSFTAHTKLLKHWENGSARWKQTVEILMHSPFSVKNLVGSREEVLRERLVFNADILLNGTTNPLGGQKDAQGMTKLRIGDLIEGEENSAVLVKSMEVLKQELGGNGPAKLAMKALLALPSYWHRLLGFPTVPPQSAGSSPRIPILEGERTTGGFALPHSPPRHSRRALLRHRRQRCMVLLVVACVLVVMLLFVSLHLPSVDSLLPRGKQATPSPVAPQSAQKASSVANNGSQPSIRVALATLRADPTWQQLLDPDSAVRQLSDQISLGKAYLSRARDAGEREFGDEMERGVRAAEAFLARSIAITRAAAMAALKEKVAKAEEKASKASAQATLASQVVSESMPKPMTCLYMRLAREWALQRSSAAHKRADADTHPFQIHHGLPPGTPNNSRLVDTSLQHMCIFSDNVLAVSAALNSTVLSSHDPSRLVFHIVTDATSFPAFVVWFSSHPPGLASLEVRQVEGESGWLNASFAPVLRQMQDAHAKSFYFSAATAGEASDPIKFRNPKYMSLLNHLRFYLPLLFPALHRIVFLDDDVIVQRDLSALFSLDMNGAVNGAVETCKGSFHRFHRYLNFSDTRLRGRFDPEGCAWAYGMNLFDLKGWRRANVTATYHYWQEQNVDHSLWKLGTLPPGLLAFNGLTHAIDPSWHVLGLGYNPHLDMTAISKAAVIHWNGDMAGSNPMPADEEEFHDAIHANAMLNAAEDFKPSDYSNIIRRYSHLGATHPSNPLAVAKAGEDEKSAGGKTRRSLSTGGGVKKGKGSSVASTLGRAAARVGRTLGAKGGSLAKSKSAVAPIQSDDESSKASEQPSVPIVLQPFMGSYGSEKQSEVTKQLQEENRRLRERIAMLEAIHAEEAEEGDDLARHRVRMLKSSNLQLEHQLLASESASLTAKAIRNELLSAMDHLHRTVGALHVRAGEDEAEGGDQAEGEQAEAESAAGAGAAEMGNSQAGTLDQSLLPAAAILLDDAQHAAAQEEKGSAGAAAAAVAKGVSKVGAAQQPLTRRNSFGGRGSAALASAARPSTPTSRGTSSFASGSPRATTPRATSSAGKGSASPTVGARRGGAAAGAAGKGKTGGGSFNARGWGVGPGKRNGANTKTAEKKTAASGAANDGDGGMDLTSAGSRSASLKDGPLVLDPSIVTSSAVSTPMGTPRAGSTPAGSPFGAPPAAAATPAPTLGSLLAASGQVAIAKEKLEELAMWSKEAREKVLMLLPAPGGKIGELPAAGAEKAEGDAEAAGGAGGAGGAEKTSMKAMGAPELPCAGNRFMATNEDGDPVAGIAANLCRSIEGSAPLLEYARVHELEGRLADLHPRLLALSSLLDHVVFPSLPAETSSAVLQEIRVAIADVYDATRALSELAALVPAGAQLFGVGTGESLMLAAAAARAEEGGGGGGEGEMMELLTAGLAGIVGEGGGFGGGEAGEGARGEVQARVAEVVGRCRKVEALWRAEMSGLQEEMGFYRGCHAAQASHVKQIASAAKDALQTVLGDAHEIVSAAATSIQKRRLQILLAVTDFENEPTPEMMQQLAAKVKEEAGTLRRFAELLPQAFSAEAKVAEVFDPLEREFKERMQAVFETLQARRAALARQRSELHGQISGRFANQSGQQGKGKLMRTWRIKLHPSERLLLKATHHLLAAILHLLRDTRHLLKVTHLRVIHLRVILPRDILLRDILHLLRDIPHSLDIRLRDTRLRDILRKATTHLPHNRQLLCRRETVPMVLIAALR